MRIIVPMAGMGKRMRPHTLTVPKPLIPVAGKPIVQWLVEDIIKVCAEKVEEIAFVIGDFGEGRVPSNTWYWQGDAGSAFNQGSHCLPRCSDKTLQGLGKRTKVREVRGCTNPCGVFQQSG